LRHPDDIYMAGANKLDDLLDWCIDLEIPVITLWVFSTEIRKRPAQEVTGILAAVEKKLRSSHLTGSSIADESACARLVVSNCCRRLRSQPCAQQKLQRKATVACI
jgi:undecaprenyl diphosphate synthase